MFSGRESSSTNKAVLFGLKSNMATPSPSKGSTGKTNSLNNTTNSALNASAAPVGKDYLFYLPQSCSWRLLLTFPCDTSSTWSIPQPPSNTSSKRMLPESAITQSHRPTPWTWAYATENGVWMACLWLQALPITFIAASVNLIALLPLIEHIKQKMI